MVLESPNKESISYVVYYMKKISSLSDYLSWIADEVIEHGTGATKTIIYCQTIKQCAVMYWTLRVLLSENIYEDPLRKDAKRVLLEMLHSCSPMTNKENILESFKQRLHSAWVLTASKCIELYILAQQRMLKHTCKKAVELVEMANKA